MEGDFMNKLTTVAFGKLPKTYEGLCHFHLPRPIHDRVELDNATELIDAMAGHDLNAEQEDYLDLLSSLVADYEESTSSVRMKKLSPVDALKYLLQENGFNASQLAVLLGVDRSLGAKIVRGKRKLTAEHISKLVKRFAVRAELFLG
jgi:antitoxin component HigA of HigAB toxin-antitoxin module